MGTFTFRLPDIGEGIAEAEIVTWHVKVGDRVEEDGKLADVMTDKATVEMESPVSGVVVQVAGAEGDMIAIGSPLVVIETDGEGEAEEAAPAPKAEAAPAPESAPDPVRAEPVEAPSATLPDAPKSEASPSTSSGRTDHGARILASPAVRARAADLGIDLAQVKPAEDGRIRHADLDAFLAYNAGGGFRAPGGKRADQQVRVIGLRRRISENMAASKRNIPHFSYVEESDVTALEEMRAQLNAARGNRPKLTMLPLLITALCRALPDFPMINARFDDEAGVVTRFGSVHLGMATQTDAGLMVPVIRDAQDKNLWQLAAEITRLAEAARNGTAKSEELSGSTITLTSLGPLGGVAHTPVINRPEVAIIGPNRIVERPMFVPDGLGGERIEKRKLMNLSISCDHRVVDGWDAASFVQAVKRLIETPVLLLAD
ncbi:dihydrolipoamide acetyltransferase family protein [Novosphingobium sp.]|jgi:2-oxoisovalerate dehydrogenase E2 component (dihydrolipoyl transacylase)|uniref:dihydrolipoamide acetyltransferase family protein n=1 Tax=Novosphingobium sp. TaxID=1874826 RepID=UPI0022CBBCE5|nr:dihydrolipoamide acetyltransferase family protein [Novosphingobium sp.]MCZ8017467.1 dihydrolipoamide acetyltransferase family protein [Novosphingobium sp.]MCZ8034010.1 dihydrolipoamide acetyltransferase family protein [Novosphingobium sp.]MCZ8051365.1 dihydrolipoamide acetyltransferase family protein [Novosphingobium sp.]MCZ8059711.1 dihydrolipoamide acetyltransferase family protein [Novosphingobium sp.]MCZ8231549.1 dihydrolipoamide acetyltransferase family protein [Novosphingobium sp.]